MTSFSQKVQLNLSMDRVNPTCYGYSDGSVTANPSGGIPPYSYLWSNGDTTQIINNLVSGNYSLTVTDAQSNMVAFNFHLGNPAPITINGNVVNVTSYGMSNGAIDLVTVQGIVGPFTYLWSSSTGGNYNPSFYDQVNIIAGQYKVVITDSLGCSGAAEFTVNQPYPTMGVINNPNVIFTSKKIPNNPSLINVYPNPSNGNVKIDSQDGEIKIVNLNTGVEVIKGRVENQEIEINNLPTGNYIISVIKENEVITERFSVL